MNLGRVGVSGFWAKYMGQTLLQAGLDAAAELRARTDRSKLECVGRMRSVGRCLVTAVAEQTARRPSGIVGGCIRGRSRYCRQAGGRKSRVFFPSLKELFHESH